MPVATIYQVMHVWFAKLIFLAVFSALHQPTAPNVKVATISAVLHVLLVRKLVVKFVTQPLQPIVSHAAVVITCLVQAVWPAVK